MPLHRGNPAMLAVNTAIAAASEQSYHLTKLHTAGSPGQGCLIHKAGGTQRQADRTAPGEAKATLQ